MLTAIRSLMSDWRWERAIERTRSRLPYEQGDRFMDYLMACRRAYESTEPDEPQMEALAREYWANGFCRFMPTRGGELAASMRARVARLAEAAGPDAWRDDRFYAGDTYRDFPEIQELLKGDLGKLYRAIYRAQFKIFYGMVFRSIRRADVPLYSQLWHADGGPGTCVISIFALSDIGPHNGGTELLPWPQSVELMRAERRNAGALAAEAAALGPDADRFALRDIKCRFYERTINERFAAHVVQMSGPPGTLFCFSNNVIHRGGYPMPGNEREVALLHAYPAIGPVPFEAYETRGIEKTAGYPANPEF